MEEKFESIIEGCLKVFMRYGIKSLTMDDIARELGISKKTLYKYVSDKSELVAKVLEMYIAHECVMVEAIKARGINAIDEQFEISKLISSLTKDIHPSVVYDLQKYYPEAMAMFNDYKQNSVKTFILGNLEKGIQEGLYRVDLKKEIIAEIYISKIEGIFNPLNTAMSIYKFEEMLWELFRYHIRGIASQAGIDYLVAKVQRERNS